MCLWPSSLLFCAWPKTRLTFLSLRKSHEEKDGEAGLVLEPTSEASWEEAEGVRIEPQGAHSAV